MAIQYLTKWKYRQLKRSLGKVAVAGMLDKQDYFRELDLLKARWRASPGYDGEE